MTHHVFDVAGVDAKKELVHTLASGTGRRILFMRTKHHARKLAKQLTEAGIPSVDLHGNLSQPARDRNLAAFSAGDGAGAGRHRHRRARRPRRRRGTGGAHRSARRAQGIPASLGPYRTRGPGRRRGHGGAARAAPRYSGIAAQGRHQGCAPTGFGRLGGKFTPSSARSLLTSSRQSFRPPRAAAPPLRAAPLVVGSPGWSARRWPARGQRSGGQRGGGQHNGSQHGGGQPGRRRSSRPSSAVGTK